MSLSMRHWKVKYESCALNCTVKLTIRAPERSSQHLPTFSHNHVTNVSITTTMMMASGSEGSNHPSSDPNYNTSTTGFIHSNNSNGSSTINSNDNRMMRDMEDSLRQIEDGLDVDPNSLYRPFSAGRATWQSMSSALTNLRGRVNEFCESHGGDWGHQISERLSSAELAHSTRTPLRRLGSALGRRCQQTVTSPAAHSASSALGASQSPNAVASALEAAANAIAAAAASSTPRIEGAVDGRAPEEPITPPLHPSSSLPSSSSASSVITSSTDTSATGRRRSVLHASRSLPSLSDHRRNLELHETAGAWARKVLDESDNGVEVIHEESEEPNDNDDATAPMEVDHEQSPLEDTPILLSESSHARLDASRRSVLFSSESSHALSSAMLDVMQVDDDGDNDSDVETPPKQSPSSTTVYSWGSGVNSLHDDGTHKNWESAKVSISSRIGRAPTILSISTSASHSAVVTPSGVFVCGQNYKGQVDPSLNHELVVLRPVLIESITVPILQVSCGSDHTAALTATGVVLTWGGDEYGQLGQLRPNNTGNDTFVRPQAMALARKRAASVACGDQFTLVLTTRMEVLCCGVQAITGYDNGRPSAPFTPSKSTPHPLPATLPELECLPIVSIAAGKNHAAVVTAMGSVLAWGKNAHGCCGRASPKVLYVPVPIRIPTGTACDSEDSPQLFPGDDTAVVQAACGAEHTVLVTISGRVFVCGANREGQLGLAGGNEVVEFHVVPLPLDAKIVNAQAGEAHTLLTDDAGDLWLMGNGTQQPTRLLHGTSVVATAAGGRHSIAIASNPLQHKTPTNAPCRELSNLLTGSNDLNGPESIESLVKAVEAAEDNVENGGVSYLTRDLAKRAEELIKTPAVLNSLFLDPQELEDLYLKLLTLGRRGDRQAMANAIEHGMSAALEFLKSNNVRLLYPESLRFLLLFIQCPLFVDWDNPDISFDRCGDVMVAICDAILGLSFEGYKSFLLMVSSIYSREHFVRFLVQPLLKQLEKGLDENAGRSQRLIPLVVSVLSWLHNASNAGGIASAEDFYSKAVNKMDGKEAYLDLFRWKSASKSQRSSSFFICAHPFLFSPGSKRNLLQIENQMEMFNTATADGVTYNVMEGTFQFDPFWVLEVEREQLLPQTLRKIADAKPNDLRKKLRIVFKGEEGVDAGGVTREFFQLISAQLFDVNSGMWLNQLDDEQVTWFNAECFWNDEGYHLVGILVGLAVYNSVLLDVNFPSAVYRKLLGLELGLEDVPDKAVQKSFRQLLDYEGDDIEDMFCLNFALNWMDLGRERTIELRPGGSSITVNQENKEEYVRLYVKWLLEESIHAQYDAFERGFMRIMQNSTLDFLSPEELELLVVGTPELDFSALEANAEYEGGYDCNSEVVKHFWHFVKSCDTDTQLKLLKFATGSSKAPIGGLGELTFKIQRAGPDSMQLPTSHTCFNTLLLPEYSSYDKLAERLGRAILECEGFGLQ